MSHLSFLHHPLRKPKTTLSALALAISSASMSSVVHAGFDFSSYSCTPGTEVARLPDSHYRVMSYAYHDGA